MVQHILSNAKLKPNKASKKSAEKYETNFFELAKTFAQDDCHKEIFGNEKTKKDYKLSPFLDFSYQENVCSYSDNSKKIYENDLSIGLKKQSLSKLQSVIGQGDNSYLKQGVSALTPYFNVPQKCVFKNGVIYSPEEIMCLINSFSDEAERVLLNHISNKKMGYLTSPLAIHEQILNMCTSDRRPFFLTIGDEGKNYRIKSAQILRAHRLKKKSLQKKSGVAFNIRYFHASFTTSTPFETHFDLVYWLWTDPKESESSGEFIFGNDRLSKMSLWNSTKPIKEFVENNEMIPQREAEILKIYLRSF